MRRVLKNTIGISVSFIVLVVTSGCMTNPAADSCSYYYQGPYSCGDNPEDEIDWGNTALLGGGIVAGIVVGIPRLKRKRRDAQLDSKC